MMGRAVLTVAATAAQFRRAQGNIPPGREPFAWGNAPFRIPPTGNAFVAAHKPPASTGITFGVAQHEAAAREIGVVHAFDRPSAGKIHRACAPLFVHRSHFRSRLAVFGARRARYWHRARDVRPASAQ
ncbi:MAG TPA: hypothetical protein VG916_04470 [Gemmatimonadaceae bacterium]|nr:hypothetical protein [Gemmatimonadaceae bacterium]